MIQDTFSKTLLQWYAQFGRKNLPWQHPRDPYRIWVSEIMLQQTQVKTVIPYFLRFVDTLPSVQALAAASSDTVMSLWSGLGYYSRAKNLHNAAKQLIQENNGLFPQEFTAWQTLPGIGRTTAAAICAQAYNHKTPILDANVKRLLSRLFMLDGPHLEQQLWQKAEQCMPEEHCATYTQAIMDFGALLCTNKNPGCDVCPFSRVCMAHTHHQTHLYPVKKKKLIKPTKALNFYYIQAENAVFLIKNPSSGIWANLWSLPADSGDEHQIVAPFIQSNQPEHQPKFQTTIKHTFSHYHLLMHIWSLASTLEKSAHSGRWFTPMDTLKVGVAKPIHTLIHES